jgi:hypothetical protein
MRRQALDRERAGDADARIIAVGLVVEIFELGLGRDRGVDLLLPCNACRPPVAVKFHRLFRPVRGSLARNFPLFPGSLLALRKRIAGISLVRTSRRTLRALLSMRWSDHGIGRFLSMRRPAGGVGCFLILRKPRSERRVSLILRSLRSRRLEGRTPPKRGVEPAAQRLQRLLPLLPDHIDLGVIGDRFQSDVRHPLVDEALANVAARRRLLRWRASDLALLALPLLAVGEQVIGIACAHDPRSGERQRHTRSINRDPPPPPLFGDIGRRSRAARRIQYEVTWIRAHQNAALNDCFICPDNIELRISESRCSGIRPQI